MDQNQFMEMLMATLGGGDIAGDEGFNMSDFLANSPTENLSFGEANEFLKEGECVARSGWNGKNMFLIYVPESTVVIREETPYGNAGLAGQEIKIDAHIDMYTAQGTVQPGWLASQADLQANDWIVITPSEILNNKQENTNGAKQDSNTTKEKETDATEQDVKESKNISEI